MQKQSMKIFLILILSFFTLSAFAQEYPDSGFTNKAEAKNLTVNGEKEGKWIEYHNSIGEINTTDTAFYSLTIYRYGVPYGTVRCYFKNDSLMAEMPYGKKNGIQKIYWAPGKLLSEGPLCQGCPLCQVCPKTGIEKHYYPSGNLRLEETWIEGKIVSTKNYDENGNEIK